MESVLFEGFFHAENEFSLHYLECPATKNHSHISRFLLCNKGFWRSRRPFGTKRSQVQILSPRPKNGRKSSNFQLFLMQFAQIRVFGTFPLQLFCNLSKCTKRPQASIYSEFAIYRHNILHFSKWPSQFAWKRHRLEQLGPAALPNLICRFVWKSPCPPGEPPTPCCP